MRTGFVDICATNWSDTGLTGAGGASSGASASRRVGSSAHQAGKWVKLPLSAGCVSL